MKKFLVLLLLVGLVVPVGAEAQNIFRRDIIYVGGGTGDPLNGDGGSSFYGDGRATFDGKLLIPDGTVGAPGIGFKDDTNTGIYRIGADDLGFTLGGVEGFSLDASAFTAGVSSGANKIMFGYDGTRGRIQTGAGKELFLSVGGNTFGTATTNIILKTNQSTNLLGDLNLTNSTDPTITATTAGQNLVLTTASGDVFIDDSLGVHTGSPQSLIHSVAVNSGGDVEGIRIQNNTLTDASSVSIHFGVTNSGSSTTAKIVHERVASANRGLQFWTWGGSLTEKMRITGDGDLNLYAATDPTITATVAGQNLVLTTASGDVRVDDLLRVLGRIQGSVGAQNDPSYQFWDDPDTGMYRRGTNGLGFTTGGIDAFYADSSQFVVIKKQLNMVSTSHAFLPPRVTTTQRDAIASPVAGMVIWNTTTGQLEDHNGTAWAAV